MKIDRVAAEGRNLFTGYGEGYVAVGGRRIERSIVVSDTRLEDWTARGVAELTREHFAAVLALSPQIVLLGTGSRFDFPDPAALAQLHEARIGVEVMDTRAACRTFNILVGEGRNVVAALIVD